MSPADIATLVAGGFLTWLVIAAFTVIVLARFFAVSNPQQLSRSNEEQPLRDGDPQRLGRLSVGGQVNNLNHQERF